VRDDDRKADLLYQQPVTTYQAYNNYPSGGGGKSVYGFSSEGGNTVVSATRAVKVSFDRPYSKSGAGQVFRWEHDLLMWLEREGYDISYTTSIDVHAGRSSLTDYKGFISPGHDEYWTKEMMDFLEIARDEGTGIAVFGANAMYWQIRMESSNGDGVERVMTVYKDGLVDPEPNPNLKTIKHREVGRPEQGIIGVQYGICCAAQNGDYIVQNSDHWIYQGSGFDDGDAVPGILGYEVDARAEGIPLTAGDKQVLLSNSFYAGSLNRMLDANSSIYRTNAGNWVFASGTMSWSWALNRSDYVDAGIQQTTRNLLNRLTE